MAKCPYCSWRDNKHDPRCPQQYSPQWDRGWKDGRSGKSMQEDDEEYNLGWGEGLVALEEAENGYDPRFE